MGYILATSPTIGLGDDILQQKHTDSEVSWGNKSRTSDVWRDFEEAPLDMHGTPRLICKLCGDLLVHPAPDKSWNKLDEISPKVEEMPRSQTALSRS